MIEEVTTIYTIEDVTDETVVLQEGQLINITDNIPTSTHAATSKTTPVNADELPILDSATSFSLKKLSWSNLKATLKSYFDTLYGSGSGDMTKAVYDTTNKQVDIYNTDNHVSGTTNKVFTATEKTKLAGIETGAEVNNISDVNATDLTNGGQTTLHSHDLSSKENTGVASGLIGTHESTYNHSNYNTAYSHSQLTTGNPHNVTKTNVGLGNVDNTSDANKPISSATQTALNAKQDTLTFGIADTNKVQINSATVTNGEYAKFTATGLESRSTSEVLSDIGGQASLGFTPENVANKVTAFQVTPDDTHYASEKLVKDSLDGKSSTSHNHSGVYEPVKGADDNYVTDAQLIVISNTSGTNTGDNATNSQYSGLATSKENVLTGAVVKATIHDNDRFIQLDSESTNATSYNLWSVIKSTLKTYFDGLYFLKTIFTAADEIQVGTGSGTTNQITLGASQLLGKKSTGSVTNLTATEARAILNVGDGAEANNISDVDATDLTDGGETTLHSHPGGGGATLWTAWTGASRTSDAVISSTTHLPAGTGVRFKATGGTYRHGIIKSIATDAHTIMGEPCTTSDDDVFEYDASGLKTGSLTVHLPDNYNPADTNAWLATYLNMKLGWKPALCGAFMIAGIDIVDNSYDGSTNPKANMMVQGTTNKLFADVSFVDGVDTSSGATAVTAYCYANGESRFDIFIDNVGTGDAFDADIVVRWVIL